jgi:hypothetical protein
MKCNKVREEIDGITFNRDFHLEEAVTEHINSCEKCREYYEDGLKAGLFIKALRKTEPVLDQPEELTESILAAVSADDKSANGNAGKGKFYSFRVVILQRVLAAASVCLIIVFGIEQYNVVNKVMQLEEQFESIAVEPDYFMAVHLGNILKPGQFNQTADLHQLMKAESNYFGMLLKAARLQRTVFASSDEIKDLSQMTGIKAFRRNVTDSLKNNN